MSESLIGLNYLSQCVTMAFHIDSLFRKSRLQNLIRFPSREPSMIFTKIKFHKFSTRFLQCLKGLVSNVGARSLGVIPGFCCFGSGISGSVNKGTW